jgi:thiol-disulfide isomerase/thioredoxin
MLRKHRRWLAGATAVAVALVAFKVWRTFHQLALPTPALVGVAVDGRPVDLAQSVQAANGKPVMVVFWATWCPECVAEEDEIRSIARDYEVLAVAWRSEGNKAIAKYMAEHKLGYPSLNDVDGKIAETWDIRGVPTHFIVGRDGKTRYRIDGSRSEWKQRARLWWASTFGV